MAMHLFFEEYFTPDGCHKPEVSSEESTVSGWSGAAPHVYKDCGFTALLLSTWQSSSTTTTDQTQRYDWYNKSFYRNHIPQ